MGVETAKALRARRRETAARIDRLIVRADERNPLGAARRARISEGARLVRRRLKSLAVAREEVTAIEVELGRALLGLVDQGLSRNEAFELANVPRHLGRRYVDLALCAQREVATGSSTDSAPRAGRSRSSTDRDGDGALPHPATTERTH